jgi:hypothetical protein
MGVGMTCLHVVRVSSWHVHVQNGVLQHTKCVGIAKIDRALHYVMQACGT